MKTKALLCIGVVAVLLGCAFAFLGTRCWLGTLPAWELSVEGADDGSIISIGKTKSEKPTYQVIVKQWKVSQPFVRMLRSETIRLREVATTFVDDDVPPGRWTLTIGGNKLDIMPARLVVNDSLECEPGGTLVIRGDKGGGQKGKD